MSPEMIAEIAAFKAARHEQNKRKALRNLGILFLLFCVALPLFKHWTDQKFHIRQKTPLEYQEAKRLQNLEAARVENYIKNIKPYVPVK